MADASSPPVPVCIRGCLSAAFLRAAAQMRGWDDAKYPKSTQIILRVAIGKKLGKKCSKALCELQNIMQNDIRLSAPLIDHLSVVQKLGGKGWEELEDAIRELSHFRILAVKISGNRKFLSLILQFTPAEEWGSAATQPPPRSSALVGHEIMPCGARTCGVAAHGPRRIELS